jgi:AraC-like DNA-binding protein
MIITLRSAAVMNSQDLIFLHNAHLPECRAHVDKCFEGYSVLQLMTSGAIELYYDDRRYLLKGAWYWPNYPGPHIRFSAHPRGAWWDHRFCAFTGSLVEHWRQEGLFPEAPQRPSSAAAAARSFDALLADINGSGRWSYRRAVNRLEAILLSLAEEQSRPAVQKNSRLEQIIKRLEAELSTAIDYERIADEFSISAVTLRRRFKAATGISIHRYVIQRRIEAAKSLLAGSDKTVKEIAAELGYSDEYFFSRQFKRIAGVSPVEYRKSRIV